MKNLDIIAAVKAADPEKWEEKAYGILLGELVGMAKIRYGKDVTPAEMETSAAAVGEFFVEVKDINVRGQTIGKRLGFDPNFFARCLMSRLALTKGTESAIAAIERAVLQ